MIPLRDENPTVRPAVATFAIVGVNLVVWFLVQGMGRDPALRQMVVIGHSQGGILTKMQVVDSGDHIWKTVSDEKLEDIGLKKEVEELLRKAAFFERVPSVARVNITCVSAVVTVPAGLNSCWLLPLVPLVVVRRRTT